jgi:hypothetical protein
MKFDTIALRLQASLLCVLTLEENHMSVAIETPTPTTITYPESDGKPLGETDVYRREIMEIIGMLQRYYANHPEVYVSGNLMVYYEPGNPSAVVSPDIFLVKGVPNHERRIYKLWEEQHAPAVIFEITRNQALGIKHQASKTYDNHYQHPPRTYRPASCPPADLLSDTVA